ncbi:MAG TPA: HPr family phosphocarrier protein, partial [Sulfurovum sp.]|uniref:HPr family phosphocarrier protein n=1 Tax=Sulfurovum sp. TaxID=1969726 RepID=UPI002F9520BC
MSLFKTLFSKPISAQLTVTSSNGFHLRPVAQFSALAKTFSCRITATFKDRTVDTKSVNTLLSLSLEPGDTFTLVTRGKESEQALEKLQSLFETLMQQDPQRAQIEKTSRRYEGTVTEGEIISEGIAIAPAYLYRTKEVQHESSMDFEAALHASMAELEERAASENAEAKTGIYLAQKELLASLADTSRTLTELEARVAEESQKLLGTRLASKTSDYQDILQRVKKHLGLEVQVRFPDTPFILLCHDLLPSDIEALVQTNVAGVILKETSVHSHTAILLRAAGICSMIAETEKLVPDETIILDAHAGVFVQNPSSVDLEHAEKQQQQDLSQKALSSKRRFEPALSQGGRQVHVYANVSDIASAETARAEGAEGIGLLRSEFLFTSDKPSFDTQQKAYRELFALFDDITVRTLDVGGDKALPYIQLPPENNPFLGVRGIRLFRTHPELLEEQLHAIFSAAGEKRIKIMF